MKFLGENIQYLYYTLRQRSSLLELINFTHIQIDQKHSALEAQDFFLVISETPCTVLTRNV